MSAKVRIYHNPDCVKSRDALDYLRSKGIEPEIVNYLQTPPDVEQLRALTKLMGVAPSSLIRANDFQRLNLPRTSDREQLLTLIAENPAVLHRPIVVVDDRAARIARPPEVVDELLG